MRLRQGPFAFYWRSSITDLSRRVAQDFNGSSYQNGIAPDDFPVDRFMEVLFRIGGVNAADATALRKRYRERPADFLLVASGTAVLLRYLSDDGLERLTFAWAARDRAYFLSGAPLTEVEAIAIANSLK